MAARVHPSKRSTREAPRSVPLDGPSRRPRHQRERVLPLAFPSHLLHTRHSPTTESSSQRPSTRPSRVSAAMYRFRGKLPTAHQDSRNHHTFTTCQHTRPTTVCHQSQTSSQNRFTPRGIITALVTHRTRTTSRPCHPQVSPLHTRCHRH